MLKLIQSGDTLYVDDPNTGQQIYSTTDPDLANDFIIDWQAARANNDN